MIRLPSTVVVPLCPNASTSACVRITTEPGTELSASEIVYVYDFVAPLKAVTTKTYSLLQSVMVAGSGLIEVFSLRVTSAVAEARENVAGAVTTILFSSIAAVIV